MSIYLDNEPFGGSSITEATTLARVLETARATLRGSGRLIMTLRADERELTADEISELLEQPIAKFGRLDLVSADAANLVLQTMETCRSHLSSSFEDVQSANMFLRAGNIASAMNSLGGAIQTWVQVTEAVQTGGQLLDINYNVLSSNGVRVADAMARFATTLTSLKEAMESRDHVLLGDVLQYELDETLRQWELMLACVIEHIQAMPTCH